MAIEFTCPNGHKLKVKESSAGKTGRCPVCNALVRVPAPASEEEISEDAILGILGPHKPTDAAKPPPAGFPDPAAEDEGDIAPKKKVCPKCHSEIAMETHICPHCRTYIASAKDF